MLFLLKSMSSTPCPLLGLFWNSQISGWLEYQEKLVENFMGSNAILCGGANSGQTLFLMLWYWTTAIFLRIQLWNWKSNIFSQLHLQAQFFFISQLPEGLGMRKILAHSIRMQRIHKHQGAQFLDFNWAMWVQSPACPHRNFQWWCCSVITNPRNFLLKNIPLLAIHCISSFEVTSVLTKSYKSQIPVHLLYLVVLSTSAIKSASTYSIIF